jgi:DNA mismatch repair protein MutS
LTVLEERAAGTASSGRVTSVLDDLPLFSHQPAPAPAVANPVDEKLDAIRPDEITPKEALELIYELKKTRDAARRS